VWWVVKFIACCGSCGELLGVAGSCWELLGVAGSCWELLLVAVCPTPSLKIIKEYVPLFLRIVKEGDGA
jgi:hypothetical protein